MESKNKSIYFAKKNSRMRWKSSSKVKCYVFFSGRLKIIRSIRNKCVILFESFGHTKVIFSQNVDKIHHFQLEAAVCVKMTPIRSTLKKSHLSPLTNQSVTPMASGSNSIDQSFSSFLDQTVSPMSEISYIYRTTIKQEILEHLATKWD